MITNDANQTTTAQPIQLVFVLAGAETKHGAEELPPGMLKVFLKAEDLPGVFGSEKLAKILARHCLVPVIRRPKRLTLYWLGDVLSVADRVRRGELVIDFEAQTVLEKSRPNEHS